MPPRIGERHALLDESLFGRYLDLAPLRARRRGLVRCIFHTPDRRGSLSIDLDKGVFNCFACGARGGLLRFAELVGERSKESPRQRSYESPLQQARRWILRLARAQDARKAEWLPLWLAADYVRGCFNLAREARDAATALGPDDPRTWPLLERAAAVERTGLLIAAHLDAFVAEGRVS